MAAQSGKQFQDILCEGRAHPVDSSDPVTAKTIDDLKKQVSKQKTEIEAEKTKFRELQRSHEKEIRVIREQTEKKLDRSLDALSHRKYDEKMAEVAQVKERLLKQNQQELRTQRAELEEEMRRLERRLTREREESMRKVLDLERKRTEEELSHYLPEESVMTREEHLKAEIFRLGVEVERLEFQVSYTHIYLLFHHVCLTSWFCYVHILYTCLYLYIHLYVNCGLSFHVCVCVCISFSPVCVHYNANMIVYTLHNIEVNFLVYVYV